MLKFKNITALTLCLVFVCSFIPTAIYADTELKLGDYFTLGKYNDEPILWRYVADDENGKLFISDRIICFKTFDYGRPISDRMKSSFWEESTIRSWLNSDADSGEVEWNHEGSPGYADEAGFLSDGNFTSAERSLIKSVKQWTMLSEWNLDFATNETNVVYTPVREIKHLSFMDSYPVFWNISNLPDVYYGAAYQLQDRVFLIDELQLFNMQNNLGEVQALRTDESKPDEVNNNSYYTYFLRTPSHEAATACMGDPSNPPTWVNYYRDYNRYGYTFASNAAGIRPAFYLNETAVSGMTGSGTAEDPHVLLPDPDYISVEVNGDAVAFDVAPIMENDRVLVPMRAIFETLGATVEWEGETQTVTATKDGTVITLQIGSNIMTKNGVEIILDVPAQLVNDRTLVPIRAVSESLNAVVDWVDSDKSVIITN